MDTEREVFVLHIVLSVTSWLAYFSIFGRLQQWKLAQSYHKFAKVGSVLCQIWTKPSNFFQWLVNFCQSGEISPNLVTQSAISKTKTLKAIISKRFLTGGWSCFSSAAARPSLSSWAHSRRCQRQVSFIVMSSLSTKSIRDSDTQTEKAS